MYSKTNLNSTQPAPNRLYEHNNSYHHEFEITKLNTVDSYMSSQKESIDNLYDTLKNQISPQKISDFNKLVLDFNGYINKLSIENSRLKNKLVKAQEKLKSLEKKLVYHDKNRRRLELNLQKKNEIENDMKKEKEIMIDENTNLRNQLNEAKNMITQIKTNSEISMKENLRRNFSEWQKHEKANFIKMKKSMETEILQRVRAAKQEAEEQCNRQLENMKNSYTIKETEIKNFYEEKLRNDLKSMEEKFNDKFNYEKEIIRSDLSQKFEEYKRMSREKRNNQQSLIETFEDSIMMKDKVIKQLQQDQKEMMLKIQMVKKNVDNDNFKSVTSHNSYDDDQGNFLNDINKRLTYAKMRMGFNSGEEFVSENPIFKEPSLNNEFYTWIHETSIDTEYEEAMKRRKEKQVRNIFSGEDKENYCSFQKSQQSELSTEKKSPSKRSNFKMQSSQKSLTKHIKIEGISTGYPMDMDMDVKPTNRYKNYNNNNIESEKNKNYILTTNDLCQSEFTLRGLEQMSQGFSSKLSVKKMELSSAKKQKINLMKEGSPLDCQSLSKEHENDGSSSGNKWSECWVKVSNKIKPESFKSEMQNLQTEMRVDQDLIKTPMMTLDLSMSDKHNSNNLTNILSTHTFTRNDETTAESECKRKAERLQEKINKAMNKNLSARKKSISSKRSSARKENTPMNESNSIINLNSLKKDHIPKNLNTPKKSPCKISQEKFEINEKFNHQIEENIQISKGCFEVKYESLIGDDDNSNCNLPQVDDIITLHNDSSRNTQCEKKNSLIQQFDFKANDVNFK